MDAVHHRVSNMHTLLLRRQDFQKDIITHKDLQQTPQVVNIRYLGRAFKVFPMCNMGCKLVLWKDPNGCSIHCSTIYRPVSCAAPKYGSNFIQPSWRMAGTTSFTGCPSSYGRTQTKLCLSSSSQSSIQKASCISHFANEDVDGFSYLCKDINNLS